MLARIGGSRAFDNVSVACGDARLLVSVVDEASDGLGKGYGWLRHGLSGVQEHPDGVVQGLDCLSHLGLSHVGCFMDPLCVGDRAVQRIEVRLCNIGGANLETRAILRDGHPVNCCSGVRYGFLELRLVWRHDLERGHSAPRAGPTLNGRDHNASRADRGVVLVGDDIGGVRFERHSDAVDGCRDSHGRLLRLAGIDQHVVSKRDGRVLERYGLLLIGSLALGLD